MCIGHVIKLMTMYFVMCKKKMKFIRGHLAKSEINLTLTVYLPITCGISG